MPPTIKHPKTPTVGGIQDDVEDILKHFVTWLRANRLILNGDLPRGAIVDRYIELQWGEDRETVASWGHAFEYEGLEYANVTSDDSVAPEPPGPDA